MADKVKIGIVGAAGRGKSFKSACNAHSEITIHAVCDINKNGLDTAQKILEAREKYTDYDTMLEKSDIQAVVIATPMHFHASQAIAALKKNIHVLSEVPAAISTGECRELVSACNESNAVYMMAENYTYIKPNVLVRELARQGLFGEVYYAEGEYLHELKEKNEETPWRRKWQTGIAGITYGTHSLGPILQWMNGDRIARVCCENTKHHYKDPRGDYYAQDASVMLCKTARGALIKIRVDMISDRPHAMTNYQLQGTDGVYESNRCGSFNGGKIWLRKLSKEIKWHDIESLMDIEPLARKYMPDIWLNPPQEALFAGHGGGDFFEVFDFANAITGKAPCPIGIHEAMDMTLPGLISQQSIAQDGIWLPVPDSRSWVSENDNINNKRRCSDESRK